MLLHAVEGVKAVADMFVITVLREHVDRYGVEPALQRGLGPDVELVVLDQPTVSQPATVARTIESLGIEGPILIKDSDNGFEVDHSNRDQGNFICVSRLGDHKRITPGNKSYVRLDDSGSVTNIREKQVISDTFCVGGYGFASSREFLQAFYELEAASPGAGELHVSDVIGSMLLAGKSFVGVPVSGYRDWGTLSDWQEELEQGGTVLVQLDGYLFSQGSEYFRPTYDEVSANRAAVDKVLAHVAGGQQVLYLSTRPESLAELTEQQLGALGLPTAPVVWGCRLAPWTLVGAEDEVMPGGRARVEVVHFEGGR